MEMDAVQDFLLWCLGINYGILLIWFLVLRFAKGWMHRLHGRWFHLAPEQFDALHYAAMVVYKIGILLFNLAPWLALKIVF